MPSGPCVVCGATNYALSMGGPGICPACDCGVTPGPMQVANLRRELDAARARIAEVEAELATAHEHRRVCFARAEAAETALAEARAGAQERDAEARLKGTEIAEDLIRAKAEKLDNGPMRLGMERAANEILHARGGPANG